MNKWQKFIRWVAKTAAIMAVEYGKYKLAEKARDR